VIALLVSAALSGAGSATAPVQGPVTFELRTYAADVEIVQGRADSVTLSMPGSPKARVEIEAAGGRFEARVDGRRQLREGKVKLSVPAGSSVEITTVTGGIDATGALGQVRARTMSGKVAVRGARAADVETIEGAVEVSGVVAEVRVHTIAGAVQIDGQGPLAQAEVETSSGPVEVRGLCGKGCRIDLDSVSGEVKLALDPASSFGLRFTSHTGKLRNHGATTSGDDAWSEATWGKGEGRIECETFSADAILMAR
jgi:DUF4097 and DUF4098 domain-containing protein YvlB